MGAGEGGVDEDQAAVAGGELDETVYEEGRGGAAGVEEGGEFGGRGGWDIALDDGEVDAFWCGEGVMWADGGWCADVCRVVVHSCDGRGEDFGCEVVVASTKWHTWCSRWCCGEVGEVETSGHGVE